MNIQSDFEEFLQLLEEHKVDYMIVGGYAVGFHGYPRFTKDIDIFFEASAPNIDRLRQVLVAFGFREETVPREIFVRQGNILAIGVAPVRIDLLNDIDGVAYREAKPNVVRGKYGRVGLATRRPARVALLGIAPTSNVQPAFHDSQQWSVRADVA